MIDPAREIDDRIVAIGRWADHAHHGNCTPDVALQAIGELTVAASSFLYYRPQAA